MPIGIVARNMKPLSKIEGIITKNAICMANLIDGNGRN